MFMRIFPPLSGINAVDGASDMQSGMNMDFEQLVSDYYQELYRFALSLCRAQPDAYDLTQQTFLIWAERGHQLKKAEKVKSWLFTTLYREYLRSRRRNDRFPHLEISASEYELPKVTADTLANLEGAEVMASLQEVEEHYRVPLSLFYIGNHSYKDIAAILDIPMGTVMSRIARGKDELRQQIAKNMSTEEFQERMSGTK